nr:MAG TPA: hypothetical protein [Caudoviricetes sp.]
MRISNFTKRCADLTVPFRGLLLASITLIALSAASCRSPNGLTRSRDTDSLSAVKRFGMTLAPVPPGRAVLTVPTAKLGSLPIGAGYSGKEGRATVNVRRVSEDSLEVTATCDSLSRQVIYLQEELARTRSRTHVEERPAERISEPNGWQWFWIRMGQVSVGLFVLTLIKRRLKKYQK